MLFDLRGRRKRLIQVAYIALALLFALSIFTVLPTGGSIFDAFSGGGSSDSSAFNDQIEEAQAKVRQNPKSQAALLALARAQFSLSQSPEGVDGDTGTYNDTGQQAAVEGVDAWERYLRRDPKQPDAAVAQFAATTYAQIGDAEGALEAEQIVVEDSPRAANAWAQLALFAFASGKNEIGEQAQKKAIALTPRDQRNTVRSTLEEDEKRGKDYAKQVKEQEKAAKKQGKQKKGQPQQDPGFGPLPGQDTGLTPPGQ
jgi:tetratricopeptide (TPR) repeat protein